MRIATQHQKPLSHTTTPQILKLVSLSMTTDILRIANPDTRNNMWIIVNSDEMTTHID